MKKVLLMAIMAVMLFSCSDNQKKAESSVKAYLIEKLNDPKSYEPVQFEKLDTINGYVRGDFKKYIIGHSYRAANGFGAKMLYNDFFYLDSNLVVIKMISR